MSWKRLLLFAVLLLAARNGVVSATGALSRDGRLAALVAVLVLVFGALGLVQRERPFLHALVVGVVDFAASLAASAFAGRPLPLGGAVILLVSGLLGVSLGTTLRGAPRARGAPAPVPPGAQLARSWRAAALALLFASLVMLLVFLITSRTGLPVRLFTRDVVAVLGEEPPFLGIVSQLGLFLWSAVTAICLFAARALFARGADRRDDAWFLFWSGMLCAMLTLDDAFLLHEYVLPGVLGIRETWIVAGYFAIGVSYIAYFGRRILGTEAVLLGLAGVALGVSAVMDQVLRQDDFETFWEDGLKFAGILLWVVYFTRTANGLLRARSAADGEPRPAAS